MELESGVRVADFRDRYGGVLWKRILPEVRWLCCVSAPCSSPSQINLVLPVIGVVCAFSTDGLSCWLVPAVCAWSRRTNYLGT
jgi:hypothetical protein